ncbi:Tetratricopeptide repeat protein [Methylorubrum populi]
MTGSFAWHSERTGGSGPAPSLPGAIRARRLLAAAVIGLCLAGCQSRSPETTGSIGGLNLLGGRTERSPRAEIDALAARYASDPNDIRNAMRYAEALRATDQKTQAAAVLQQVALRNPKDKAVLAAYGKSLAEAGRYQEANEVLQNAHSPAQPDWRVLSAQGMVADQTGDHARAQSLYDAALKIVPNEPRVLSNLGLSYALSRHLDEAEATLRLAAAQPRADARVRGNLALVLGLKGRYDEAERVLAQDLGPAEVAANMTALRGVATRPSGTKTAQGPGRQLARTAVP